MSPSCCRSFNSGLVSTDGAGSGLFARVVLSWSVPERLGGAGNGGKVQAGGRHRTNAGIPGHGGVVQATTLPFFEASEPIMLEAFRSSWRRENMNTGVY
jgi:hypothetical protein